ncbi:NAD-glutamate dehydrogenase domain-containing protein [Acidithrix ferrooxidans]|uniref:NAD-specific glutamate dehydrogenase n=3 Tax=root TaxID=1 RepID=A0A0D8HHJ6_9ACTN|nr:NAD-glutamate dehydrogenase domain-containing protein [Acidithrix ferrooxidans]KJF17262.1 NAD-specific glutamate dehydrogenase [Acidithrix ferrooxidans]
MVSFSGDGTDSNGSWSKRLAQVGVELTKGQERFVDVLAASFDASFERLFGEGRIVPYLETSLELAIRLGQDEYAFLLGDEGQTSASDHGEHLLTIDVASIDQAHLVDSFVAILGRFGYFPEVTLHPLLTLERDSELNIVDAYRTGTKEASGRVESYIHFDVKANPTELELEALNSAFEDLFSFLNLINSSNADFYRDQSYKTWTQGAFFGDDEGFVPLGARIGPSNSGILERLGPDEASRIQRSFSKDSKRPHLVNVISPVMATEALIVGPAHDGQGNESGYIVGLGSKAMLASGMDLENRLTKLGELLNIPVESYSYRELNELVAMIARIELALIDQSQLQDIISSLLIARETNQIATFISCLCCDEALRIYLYVPTIRYKTGMDATIAAQLNALNNENVEFHCVEARIDARMARVDIDVVALDDTDLIANLLEYSNLIQSVGISVSRSWYDKLEEELFNRHGDRLGTTLAHRYGNVFDGAYRNDYSARIGADDVDRIESALETDGIWVGFTSEVDRHPLIELRSNIDIRLRIIHLGERRHLSNLLPLVETFGLSVVDEVPYQMVSPSNGAPIWLYDLGVQLAGDDSTIVHERLVLFARVFGDVFLFGLDSDRLNSLVLRSGLDATAVVLLRTLVYYQRFTTNGLSIDHAVTIVASYPGVARGLANYFASRFWDFTNDDESLAKRATALSEIDQIEILEHDVFFRLLVAICDATLRTNLHVREHPGDAGVIKFDSKRVPGLIEPVPMIESYVFSPTVEGIHLRSSLVARGGIRYSDRLDDYRTEILGLMKAQAVKNAVIVPHGAKGGFVLRGSKRDEHSVTSAYDSFISGLLSITDNIVDTKVLHPRIGKIYDGDDPYLVVAADKGTATFSDRANKIAMQNQFWLGDAFASGGSAGYDHKDMGITAKGAWVSVRHHFAHIGIDPERDPITVVGIGDMSGDVFGNGMLRSRSIRLVAAFDHRDIFLDPNPNPEASFDERERLFGVPRSSWKEYDQSVISAGGGVFSRSLKSITLSEEAARSLGTVGGKYAPNDLIKVILSSPVDLLWNGGIGTYFRSSGESDSDIGDKTNDSVRISAANVCAKVIGEGGNLGLSQLARIEMAQKGILINTDAIDNSAGVDTSDHEVNLKILYQHTSGLKGNERDTLLSGLTGAIEDLVLSDNIWQNWALSLASSEFDQMRGAYIEAVDALERDGGLDRRVEFIPDNEQLGSRYSLTRPELSVLLAYEKLKIKSLLGQAHVEALDIFSKRGLQYFPDSIRDAVSHDIEDHPLWPELVANQVANLVVNIAGVSYLTRTVEESRRDVVEVVARFLEVDSIFDTSNKLWRLMGDTQLRFDSALVGFTGAVRFQERATRWLLRDIGESRIADLDRFRSTSSFLIDNFEELLTERYRKRFPTSAQFKYAPGSAGAFRLWQLSSFATSIMEITHLCGMYPTNSISDLAGMFFEVGETLAVPELLDAAMALPRRTSWERQVRIAIRDEIDSVHIGAFRAIVNLDKASDRRAKLAAYQERGASELARSIYIDEPGSSFDKDAGSDRLAMLVVGTRRLRAIVGI